MSACVKQHAHYAVIAAHQNQWTACYSSRAEITGMGHLGLMPDVEPALVENAAPLLLKAFRISERFAIYAKQSRVLIVNDEALDRFFHDASPAFSGMLSALLVSRIPGPITRNRAGINAKISSGDHGGIVRREKHCGASVVARTRQLLHRHPSAKRVERLL